MQTRKEDVERQLMITASFKQYTEELTEKGSACDIACSANDLLTRTEGLVTSQNEFSKKGWKRFVVTFTAMDAADAATADNLDHTGPMKKKKRENPRYIGKLSFKGKGKLFFVLVLIILYIFFFYNSLFYVIMGICTVIR